MARPTKNNIDSGIQGWDGKIDDNDEALFNAPVPVHEHSGDETDLQSTFAAAAHDRCLVWVDHTTYGWTLYWSDGTNWRPFSHEVRIETNVTGTATLNGRERVVTLSGSPPYTVTLAPAANWAGETVDFKLLVGGGTVTLDGNASETIDGATTYTGLAGQYAAVRLYSDGTNIHVLS